MKPLRILLAISAITMVISCSPKIYTKMAKASDIDRLILVQPLSAIFVDSSGEEVIDEGKSLAAQKILQKDAKRLLRAESVVGIDDNLYDEQIRNQIADAATCGSMSVPVPEELCSVISGEGYRYGAIVFHRGLARKGGDIAKEAGVAIGVGLLSAVVTGGALTIDTGVEGSHAELFLAIVDAEKRRVVYHNRAAGESNPTKGSVIRKLLDRAAKPFYSR